MTSPYPTDHVDLTMMFAIHDALRRDLESVARAAARTGDDPARLHATNFGWELFKRFLTLHHGAEDAVLWPRMRELVADRPSDLALVDAMELEHGQIDPLIQAVDDAVADRDYGFQRLGDVTDALVTEISGHLSHEEKDALPLISDVLAPAEWAQFGDEQRSRVGLDAAALYLPWLLDGARADRTESVLKFIPPHLQELYRTTWKQNYLDRSPWSAAPERI
jgi:hemerythrin-like domain-containing protein